MKLNINEVSESIIYFCQNSEDIVPSYIHRIGMGPDFITALIEGNDGVEYSALHYIADTREHWIIREIKEESV